uniref:hypothetical protein n=1 Tax=Paractinoplanes polyasparticus TaxID=2856853 RepID=UPI001C8433D7|nr:hypothetical protein [Actinoplanes polyasparticus]
MNENESVPFFGEALLRLANEGRLVVDATQADEAIAGLEHSLAQVKSRLRVLRFWRDQVTTRIDELPDELRSFVVEALFADQVAPGQLERAAAEFPKYIQALRRARTSSGPATSRAWRGHRLQHP